MSVRTDQFQVSVSVTDPVTKEKRDLGVWDKQTGGGLDSEETTYRAAGGRRVSLGGTQTPDNVTVSRLYDLVADHANVGWLLALVGRGVADIAKTPTNASYAIETGTAAISWSGKLKRVTPPEVDSDAPAPALIELEFTIDSAPKVA